MNLAEAEVASIYYTTLLKYLGCTAYAHEEAILFGGDDIPLRSSGTKVDFADPREALPFILLQPGRHAPLPRRILIVAYGLAQGSQFDRHMTASHCEIAAMLAQRLRAVIFARSGGPDLAAAMLRKWAGKVFDPALVDAFLCYEPLLLRDATVDAWQAVVEAEPQPHLWISEAQLDEVAHAFADMVDLKIPFLRGHASGVAKLAEAATRTCGFSAPGVTAVRRAAFLHDLGRVGVANGTWEKAGPLTKSEWEQVRLHPYHSERILSSSPLLAPLAPLAGMHHERLDGSGYHRQATAATVPMAARILAAADSYQAMTHERPYRKAFSTDGVAEELLREVKRGRLDGEAVQAVLSAAGQAQTSRRRSWPAGLSDREVEVLLLLSRGASTKQVAKELAISPKTAGHHVQHIYHKIGVSTRAGAAMFAMQHDLVR